jgi:hypothetical protein
MCGSQVRVPVGEEGRKIPLLTVTLKDHWFHAKTSACPSLHHSDVILEKSTDSTHNVSQTKPHHIMCDVIQPCSVMNCMKENKRKKSGISPPKKYLKKKYL